MPRSIWVQFPRPSNATIIKPGDWKSAKKAGYDHLYWGTTNDDAPYVRLNDGGYLCLATKRHIFDAIHVVEDKINAALSKIEDSIQNCVSKSDDSKDTAMNNLECKLLDRVTRSEDCVLQLLGHVKPSLEPKGNVVEAVSTIVTDHLQGGFVTANVERVDTALAIAKDLKLQNMSDTIEQAIKDLTEITCNSVKHLTLANSDFKELYEWKRCMNAMPETGEELLETLKHAFKKRQNKPWTDKQVESFFDGLKDEVTQFVKASGKQMPNVAQWAVYLWTSAQPRLARKEFCFLCNEILREDDKDALEEMLPFILTLNQQVVTRNQADQDNKWPTIKSGFAIPKPVRVSWRGGGLPKERWPFFKPGRKFRVPGGLATSLKLETCKDFAKRSSEATKAIFEVHFSQDDNWKPSACVHVCLILESLVPTEAEFLFAPYSKFTVLSSDIEEDAEMGGEYLHTVLLAAKDNQGDEHWPCVEWI